MSRPTRWIAVLTAAALLAAPALATGVELAAAMPCCDDAPQPVRCHGEPAAAMDCCLAQPAPPPVEAAIPADARSAALTAPATGSPAGIDAAPPAATRSSLADSVRLHGLGRYTLFASLLL